MQSKNKNRFNLSIMITDKFASSLVQQVLAWIQSSSHIVILTHMSPDGDAMGSSLGLCHWLRLCDKQVSVVVPNTFPDFLSWLPSATEDLIYETDSEAADRLLAQADLIICTDFNEPKRIGSLGDRLMEQHAAGKRVIVIDHHLMVEEKTVPQTDNVLKLIYPDSPSASELVYRLLLQMRVLQPNLPALNLDAATCIYTGMMTDTGNFSFNSNYPEMYEIVGDLVRLGVNKDAVYNSVFNSYKTDRMRLMGYCLYQKMRIYPEHHTALIYLSRKELYRFNFQSGDAEGIVNLPLQIKDIYYSCFMREDKVNPTEVNLANGSKIKVKISMRSQGDRPVNTMCHEVYNGGGHKNASGGEYYGPLPEAVERFLNNYQHYFKKD